IACLRQRRIPFIKIEETALISHLMPFAAERMESRSSTQGERFFRASGWFTTARGPVDPFPVMPGEGPKLNRRW
ncbi:MAG: hypothetical protein AAGK00_20340, partial [Pseudomonadota bacterium]